MEGIEPIRRHVVVERSPDEAFKIWTDGISSWWPFAAGHSLGGVRVTGAVFEPRVGGQVYEVWDDGSQHHWAEVIVFEPPHRIVLAWHPNPDRPAATEVEVRFIGEGTSTRVELEHRAWERLGDQGPEARANYAGGWRTTLDHFAEATR